LADRGVDTSRWPAYARKPRVCHHCGGKLTLKDYWGCQWKPDQGGIIFHLRCHFDAALVPVER